MDGRISNFEQVASIRRYEISDGVGKGLDVIDCDNGKVRFLLNVSKACDIMQLYHEGQNVSFVSKNGFTKRELNFVRRFEGGMLYSCGLDSVGDREGHELHGNLHSTPATVVRAECNEKGIVVEAHIRDTALFGQNLLLKRTVISSIGSNSVKIEDCLINEGFKSENYCLLYHINLGYPLVDEGAKIVGDVGGCFARTPWSKENEKDLKIITAPVDNQQETCYFLDLKKPQISLVNEKIGKQFTLTYSQETLPHFIEWKSMASGDYAVGFEPTTSELDDKFAYKSIASGESVRFSLNLEVKKI